MCSMYGYTQDTTLEKPTSGLMFGFGSANVMDTYLSPYSYKGSRVDVISETQYHHTMHRIGIHFSWMDNMAGNVNEYDCALTYGLAHHFDIYKSYNFSIKAGPMGSAYLGCVYNERNGNNPAQAKASLMADCSVLLKYGFNMKGKRLVVEYSIDIPIVGFAYSPQFGQSYYEEFSLKHYDHNCVFANFVNTPSVRHRIILDFPLMKSHFYLGYNGVIDQTKYNNLRYHSYSHSFIIGCKL